MSDTAPSPTIIGNALPDASETAPLQAVATHAQMQAAIAPERLKFEFYAASVQLDITRGECLCGAAHCDYLDWRTGMAWEGWLARSGVVSRLRILIG